MNTENRLDALEQLVNALIQSQPDAPADHSKTLAAMQQRLDAAETELATLRAANILSESDVKRIAQDVSVAQIRGAADALVDGVVGIETGINKRIDATAVSLATEATLLREIVGSSAADAISILRDGAYHFAHGA
jgi:hypothetical protein